MRTDVENATETSENGGGQARATFLIATVITLPVFYPEKNDRTGDGACVLGGGEVDGFKGEEALLLRSYQLFTSISKIFHQKSDQCLHTYMHNIVITIYI